MALDDDVTECLAAQLLAKEEQCQSRGAHMNDVFTHT
jgi:hypothetical protein